MSGIASALDVSRLRELFDVRGSFISAVGGQFRDDPYPIWKELRESAPVHVGTLHELTGLHAELRFHGLPFADRRHFTAFTHEACDAAYRNPDTFASGPDEFDLDGPPSIQTSLIAMGGTTHRRYRALMQPSFVPAMAKWWMRNWIEQTVDGLIEGIENKGKAELNIDFFAPIPVLTITGSFGIPIERALEVRAAMHEPDQIIEIMRPIVAARRARPQDDLISVLVEAEVTDEDGTRHVLSDNEIFSFVLLLLAAGSGTTWKQMGITITALLQRPELLAAVREDRSLLRPAIEEALRWQPTDPMFSRWVTQDIDFYGHHLPKGSILHLCLGAANRDPARWNNPDEYDIRRPPRASFAFGGGPHICLGMHVARAEMVTAIGALLDRLPDLRLDPDGAPAEFVGFYERGAMEIPVLFA